MRVMLATLLVVGVFVVVPSGYVSAGGIVDNQSFEQGVEEVPLAWNLTGNATRVDTGPVYSGDWAARIAGSNDTLTQWLYIGNITLPLTCEAWGWIYASGNVTGVISLDFWFGVNGTQLSSTRVLSANNTNGGYVQGSTMMQAPVCTTHLRIRLEGTGWSDGDEVRFDDIGFYWLSPYCFIATAAYGTETTAELDVLRDFRDQVLLESTLGSTLVQAYYKTSPPVADFIAKSDFLRAITREVFINPMVKVLQWSQNLWMG
jgi:hypothetical protein